MDRFSKSSGDNGSQLFLRWTNRFPRLNNDLLRSDSIILLGSLLVIVYLLLLLLSSAIYGFQLTYAVILLAVVALLVLLLWILFVIVAAMSGSGKGGGPIATFFIDDTGAGYTTTFKFFDTGEDEFGSGDITERRRFIRWGDVRSVRVDREKYVFYLRGNTILDNVSLYCTPENFNKVLASIEHYMSLDVYS